MEEARAIKIDNDLNQLIYIWKMELIAKGSLTCMIYRQLILILMESRGTILTLRSSGTTYSWTATLRLH